MGKFSRTILRTYLFAAVIGAGALAVLSGCAGQSAGSKPFWGQTTDADTARFQQFYTGLRNEVAAQGLNPATLDAAWPLNQFPDGPRPVGPVLSSEKSQPEIVSTFTSYTGKLMSPTRIANGKQKLASHQQELADIYARTGVSPSVVVALWGIETNFGKSQGSHPVIPALATLAWKSTSRPDFYKKELFAALKVAEQQRRAPTTMLGSWAGAMGQCQFMPTSYLAYAKDGDGDGKADIWTNESDVLASAAHYLQQRKWQRAQPWRLNLTDDINVAGLEINSRGLSNALPLSEWRRRGFTGPVSATISGITPLRYYKPDPSVPAMLLGPNFSVILSWNNSSYFAYSVLALADLLIAP